MKKFIPLILISIILISCYKENRISRKIKGTWHLVESRTAGNVIGDYKNNPNVYVFETCDKAYTRTCHLRIYRGDTLVEFDYNISDNKMYINGHWDYYEFKEYKKERLLLEKRNGDYLLLLSGGAK